MSVGKICVREVDLADRNDAVWQAAERMHQRAVGALVVVNDAKEPIGVVTDRDLVERVLAERRDPSVVTVSDVMARPMTISDEASIESALARMRSGGFRRLPVVDRDGKLVGLVTIDDILMLLSEEMTQIGKLLERQTPRGVAETVQ